MQNLKLNQGSPLSSERTPDSSQTPESSDSPKKDTPSYLSILEGQSETYETLKRPDLAGRWYLFNLFSSIYNQQFSTKTPSNEDILRSSILKNVNVFGSACDPNEVIVKGDSYSEAVSNGITNPDSVCDNRDFWDPMRRDTSILRNGWKNFYVWAT